MEQASASLNAVPGERPVAVPAEPKPPPGLFVLLSVAVFLEAVSIGVLFPLLARIQADHRLPTYGLGLMSGAAFFASLASQIGLARMLDGRHARTVLLAGLALAVAGPLWFALGGDLWSLTAARGVSGLAYGVVMPAALKVATAGVRPDRRGARLGLVSSAQMSGIVLGPLVGVGLYTLGGVRLPFLAVAGASVLVLAALTCMPAAGRAPVGAPVVAVAGSPITPPAGIPSPGIPGPGFSGPGFSGHGAGGSGAGGSGDAGSGAGGSGAGGSGVGIDAAASGRSHPTLLRRPGVTALLLLAVASQMPNGLYDALWSRLLTDKGGGTFLIGLSLTLFGIPFVALAPIAGRLAGRKDPLLWSVGALMVTSAIMALYGLVASAGTIVMLGMIEAVGQAFVVPAGYAATDTVFPDDLAATGQGWFSAAGTAAAGTAAVAAAPAYAALGAGPVFGGGAAISVVLGLVSAGLWVRSRHVTASG